ncbi:MAG: hypothetical protein KDC58_02625 [Cyclobacteriaceae bacterium]|nr:hypothetical protein [Cyclobacteriaceae bacterium]
MKTNFTNGKLFLAAFAIIAVTLSSCKKDEETPALDISGSYALSSATLVDGDVDASGSNNMFIQYGMALLNPTSTDDVDVAPGESTFTTIFVNAILGGAAPCEQSQGTYTIDFVKDGSKVAFVCTSEGNTSDDLGTYELLENNTTISMNINVSFSPVPINITINDVEIDDDGNISGTVERFPMIKYAGPIGVDNLQYISASITLQKL